MPDGDQYNGKLKPRYIRSYEMLCEEKFSPQEVERKVLEKLRQSIREMGDGMFEYLRWIADNIQKAFRTEALSKADRCRLANRMVDQIGHHSNISPRIYSQLEQAAKSYIHNVKYGITDITEGAQTQILFRCFNRMYEADFKEPVGHFELEGHHKEMDHLRVMDRLNEMEPGIKRVIETLATSASEKQSVMNLRLPRQKRKPVDHNHENLL